MAELPLVLCGPMVRKATRNAVSLFVAVHQPCMINLSVWADDAGRPGALLMQGQRTTVPLGGGLHVAVITAHRPEGTALTWGTACLYNLEFRLPTGNRTLLDPGVVTVGAPASAVDRLVYGSHTLPGFRLPSSRADRLRVLHGSCRKPHGAGDDGMVLVDQVLEAAHGGHGQVPQQLFLTGDQIYADDVHPDLLAGLSRLEGLLLGSAERTALDRAYPGQLEPGKRKALILKEAGLSSTSSASHLVTFGEFICMYLLAWSPALWGAAGLANHPKLHAFQAGLGRVRRALAQVATGMMLDDHEVTDDWNIRPAWSAQAAAHPLGRQILRNALAAYAIFQHWGNQPEAFELGQPGRAVLDAVQNQGGHGAPEALDGVLGPLPTQRQQVSWSWRWADNPLFEVVALDCRTRRCTEGGLSLLSEAHLDHTLGLAKNQHKPTFSIVISPTPMLGVAIIESVQLVASSARGREAVLKYDYEPWSASHTYNAFVRRLLDRAPAVVLSGDVHYGFVASAQATDGPHRGRRIINCTSSALKNQSGELVKWGKALGGSGNHGTGSLVSQVQALVTPVAAGTTSLQEQVVGGLAAPAVGQVVDLLLNTLNVNDHRTAVVAESNLGDLSWPGAKLRHILHTAGHQRVDDLDFPLEGDH